MHMVNKRFFSALVALALAGTGIWWVGAGRLWAQQGDPSIEAQMTATASEFRIVYSITLVNSGTSDAGDIYLAGKVPEASRFMEVTATPPGVAALGQQGDVVVWLVSKVPAQGKVGPFSYKVAPSERYFGGAHAWVRWKTPSEGIATSSIVEQEAVVKDLPKRGCPDCHYLRDPATKAVTIAYEAKVRGGPNHPEYPAETTVDTCLTCHAPGTGAREGMGVVAPKMLRDIVHPVHLNSPSWRQDGTYKGNCFTCHNVDGRGRFVLLGEKLDTDFRGIPREPVKGIPPSEGR